MGGICQCQEVSCLVVSVHSLSEDIDAPCGVVSLGCPVGILGPQVGGFGQRIIGRTQRAAGPFEVLLRRQKPVVEGLFINGGNGRLYIFGNQERIESLLDGPQFLLRSDVKGPRPLEVLLGEISIAAQ